MALDIFPVGNGEAIRTYELHEINQTNLVYTDPDLGSALPHKLIANIHLGEVTRVHGYLLTPQECGLVLVSMTFDQRPCGRPMDEVLSEQNGMKSVLRHVNTLTYDLSWFMWQQTGDFILTMYRQGLLARYGQY